MRLLFFFFLREAAVAIAMKILSYGYISLLMLSFAKMLLSLDSRP